MIEIRGNIFDITDVDAICVTTNGVLKANGELVMGKGLALQFAKRWPNLASHFGKRVKEKGNRVYSVLAWFVKDFDEPYTKGDDICIVSFPTKHHWRDKSDLHLIEESAKQLVELAGFAEWKKVILPRPGCGLGGLKWEDVKPVIEPILDDRFYVIS